MPIQLAALAPLLGAGLSGGSSVLNNILGMKQSALNTGATIKHQTALAKYAYGQEMEQLKYMNEYNTPANQKQRLIDANLNPALMYKGQPQNTQTMIPRYQAPDVDYSGRKPMQVPDVGSLYMQYQDFRIKDAQTNNLKAQNDNIQMDTALKAATKGTQLANTAKSQFDLELAKEMKKYSLDIMETSTFRAWSDYLNSVQDWNVKQQDIDIKKLERQLKSADLKLRSKGVYPGDPVYLRTLLMNVPGLADYFKNLPKIDKSYK